ncbi:MAG TPA: Rieske (2Fe-2S) protein [Propionibacteriaceae bacterium]|nr:Rieske (2Fe-2S) protein [Propionibacteriaceae bacterium]
MTDRPETQTTATGASRRQVLRTAGLVALVGGGTAAFAGCGADSDAAAPSAGTSSSAAESSAPSSAAPSSAAPSSAPPSSAASSSAPTGGTTVATSTVPEGGGVIVEKKYVVTQPAAGEFKAFTAICTHKGCPVQKVENKEIMCPCHGSRFSITDGSVINGPAENPLAPVNFSVSGSNVVISA